MLNQPVFTSRRKKLTVAWALYLLIGALAVSVPAVSGETVVASPQKFAGATPLQWSVRMADSEMVRRGDSLEWKPDGKAKWDYAAGLFTLALLKLDEAAPNPHYVTFAANAIGSFIAPDGAIRGYKPADFNLDNLNPGKTALALWRHTGDR